MAGVRLTVYPEREQNNFQYVVAEIDAAEAGLSRDELLAVLKAENVLARRYFFPGCHRMMPYSAEAPAGRWSLPETERLSDRVLAFPTGTAVGAAEIGTICEIVRAALAQAREIKAHGR